MSGRAPSSLVKLAAACRFDPPTTNTRPFDNAGTSNFSMGGGQTAPTRCCSTAVPTWPGSAHLLQPARRHRPGGNGRDVPVRRGVRQPARARSTSSPRAARTCSAAPRASTPSRRSCSPPPFSPSAPAEGSAVELQPGGLDGGRAAGQSPASTGGTACSGPSVRQHPRAEAGPTLTTVPTEAMRHGDFSALLGLGDAYRIYDPMTAVAEGQRRRASLFPTT